MASSSFTAGTSIDVPQTQNTAPVLQFRCLYTQDLRRKQKRWQDGRLKFHTFNKRVMVYDERYNFVGDTHWREDTPFHEGEELELERGGIMVEVGECVGKREQDLSELVDKRVKDREGRAAARITTPSPSRPHVSIIRTPQPTSGPLQHKPLNALLTATGHYGRAVIPITSPFEEKQHLIDVNKDGPERRRSVKRRKPNEDAPSKRGYAQNLIGATLSLACSKFPSTATTRYEPARAPPNARDPPPPTIDLTSDRDEEEERGNGTRRAGVKDGRVSKDYRGKDQKRLKRSPARGGYGSILTGASLTLSRPENLSPKRTHKILPVGIPTRTLQQKDDSSSSEAEEDCYLDIGPAPVATKLIPVPMPLKNPTRNIIKSSNIVSTINSGSSPSTLVDDPTPTMKISKNLNRKQAKLRKELPIFEDQSLPSTMASLLGPKSTKTSQKPPAQGSSAAMPTMKFANSVQKPPLQNASAAVLTPEQPASILRIKARLPRKMMMLMDRPSSRSSGMIEASSTSRLNLKQQNSDQASNEVVLSQASMHLEAFCQKQEQIIQARLNGRRPAPDLEDLLSSPEDSSINHQSIDLLLSRKNQPAESKTVVEPRLSPSTSRKTNPGAQTERAYSTKEHNMEAGPKSQPKVASNLGSSILNDGPRVDELASPGIRNPSPKSNANRGEELSTSYDSAPQNNRIAASPIAAPMNPVATIPRRTRMNERLSKSLKYHHRF
jgi:Protein of unknown function (DUF2439)